MVEISIAIIVSGFFIGAELYSISNSLSAIFDKLDLIAKGVNTTHYTFSDMKEARK